MNQLRDFLQWLQKLDQLEREQTKLHGDSATAADSLSQIASLRALLPTSILSHHDGLKARGKRSIAAVRRGVCGGCNLRVPSGRLFELRQAQELTVCDNCEVFIYLAVEDATSSLDSQPTKKLSATKKRRAKKVASLGKGAEIGDCAHP